MSRWLYLLFFVALLGGCASTCGHFGKVLCSESRQRGFIQLGLMAYVAIGAAVLILALGVAVKVQTSRLESVRAEYAGFVAEVKAKGELAEQERVRKEAEYANSIKSAVAGRDVALKRLRDSSGSRQTSLSPTPAAGSDLLCFAASEFAGAVERFRGGIRSIVTTGDEANIDAKALIEAWPRSTP